METAAWPRLTASLTDLTIDPYPFTKSLRQQGSIGWVEALGMWWVVGYRDVERVLRDTDSFATGTAHSLIFDTFGKHMLTLDGAEQDRQKSPFRPAFAPQTVRRTMEGKIGTLVDDLIDTFHASGVIDLRQSFASRLPILSVLELFGLPRAEEAPLRAMYDGFEAALSNFLWDPKVRASAQVDVAAFHDIMQGYIERTRGGAGHGLLADLVRDTSNPGLTDEEVRRNLSIIFFGGISTVEALILNALYVLCTHSHVRAQVEADHTLVSALIEETMRWMSPVQSATRHVVQPVVLGGVRLQPGDTVNCMLGAANRDPGVFDDPDRFILGRSNARSHLGFAAGNHFCLGSHLARLEARIAISRLLNRLPDFGLASPDAIEIAGYEFRQPVRLDIAWRVNKRGG